MPEKEIRYTDELDPENLTYILYMTEVSITVDESYTDHRRDEVYEETTEHVISEMTYYYKLKRVIEDKEGGGGKVYSYRQNKELYHDLFDLIMDELKEEDKMLYDPLEEDLNPNTHSFKRYPEYRGTDYIALFEKY